MAFQPLTASCNATVPSFLTSPQGYGFSSCQAYAPGVALPFTVPGDKWLGISAISMGSKHIVYNPNIRLPDGAQGIGLGPYKVYENSYAVFAGLLTITDTQPALSFPDPLVLPPNFVLDGAFCNNASEPVNMNILVVGRLGDTVADLFDGTTVNPPQIGSLAVPLPPFAWSTWSPTLSQSGQALPVAVQAARYATAGGLTLIELVLAVQHAGVGGNGLLIGGLPQPIPGDSLNRCSGQFTYLSGGRFRSGTVSLNADGQMGLIVDNAINGLGCDPNMAAAVGDVLRLSAWWFHS